VIREGKNLPADVLDRVPSVVAKIAEESDVVAMYAFGSLVESGLNPLSDMDFAVLLSDSLSKGERFLKSIDLFGLFNETLKTDEVDLVILNDAPYGFADHILKTGRLLHCRDRGQLIDFIEKTKKVYLDFKPVREQFDQSFLEGIGYHG